MPLYEFICAACQHKVELLVSADERPKCPDCGKEKLERQLSLIASPNSPTSGAPDESCGAPNCGRGRGVVG